jgi:hypothetical protein
MRTRLGPVCGVGALALLVTLVGCKQRRSEAPEHDSSASATPDSKRNIKPAEVCKHLAHVAATEAGTRDSAIDRDLLDACEAEVAIEAGVRGTDNWNEFARCVLASRNPEDLELCNHLYPLPQPGPGSRELAVCEHLIEVLMLETAAQSGQVPQLTAEERERIEDDCARSLVLEQKPQRSPEAYEQMLDCMAGAQTRELMRACE